MQGDVHRLICSPLPLSSLPVGGRFGWPGWVVGCACVGAVAGGRGRLGGWGWLRVGSLALRVGPPLSGWVALSPPVGRVSVAGRVRSLPPCPPCRRCFRSPLPFPRGLPPGQPRVHHGSTMGQTWAKCGSTVGQVWAHHGRTVGQAWPACWGKLGNEAKLGGGGGTWVNSGSNMGQSWVIHGSSVGQVWDNHRSVAGQLVGAGAGRPRINRCQGIGMTGPRLGQPGIDGGPTIGYAERSWAVYRGRGNRATLSSCSRCHHVHVYMSLQFL